jgi:hypothetical protein
MMVGIRELLWPSSALEVLPFFDKDLLGSACILELAHIILFHVKDNYFIAILSSLP